MAASSGRGSSWWDRDVDCGGRIIRLDVRHAAHQIWERACWRVRWACGDEADAGWLMESAVERISRYLDKKDLPLFSNDINRLLLRAFSRILGRYTKKLQRLKLMGGISDLPEPESEDDWGERANNYADLTNIFSQLNPRSSTMFSLRLAGFTWREIAQVLKMNEVAVKRSFWREIRRIQNVHPLKPRERDPR